MTGRKSDLGSDLAKAEAHRITPEEYAEIPELTEEWFANAELHVGGVKVARGRPRSATTKKALKLRIDPDVIAAFRAKGPGWQTRMNAVLRKAVIGRPAGQARKKAVAGQAKRKRVKTRASTAASRMRRA